MLKSLALPRYFKKNNYNILTPPLAPETDRSPVTPSLRRSPSNSTRASARWLRARFHYSPLTRWHRKRKGFSMLAPNNFTLVSLLAIGFVLCCLSGPPLCQGSAVPEPVAKSKGTISTYATRTSLARMGVADTSKIVNLTRQHGGDLFYTFGKLID